VDYCEIKVDRGGTRKMTDLSDSSQTRRTLSVQGIDGYTIISHCPTPSGYRSRSMQTHVYGIPEYN
jgi:hypothetical protein